MDRPIDRIRQYQFVSWFPDWRGFWFRRFGEKDSDLAMFFKWFLSIGFWEIRKWQAKRPY